jgi:hypothetical protein
MIIIIINKVNAAKIFFHGTNSSCRIQCQRCTDAGGRAHSGAWVKYGMELIGLIARHPRLWRLQAWLQPGWPGQKMIKSTSRAAFAGKPAGGKR